MDTKSLGQRLAERDLAVVRENSHIVFELGDNGEIKEWVNPNFKLDVIAIIGRGEKALLGLSTMPKALLCEIGLNRSRPYCTAYYRPKIRARRKFFALTREQYLLVAPIVFAKLLELAQEKVSNWRNPTFYLPTPNNYFKRGTGKSESSIRYKEQPRGVRFSFSLLDEDFVNDVHWAELNGNRQLARHLVGLAHKISLCRSKYRDNGRSLE